MPRIVDKEAKKKEIVAAALKEFAKRGVANTKMADIAQAAEIGKGTIYEYFRDKNEIFLESFHQFIETMDTALGKRIYKITDPVLKLKVLVTTWTEMIDNVHADYVEIMLEFWAEGIRVKHDFPSGVVNLKKLYADFRLLFKSILDEGIRTGKFRKINTTLTASILLGALDGIMLQWFLDKSIFSLNEITEHLLDEFLKGIIND